MQIQVLFTTANDATDELTITGGSGIETTIAGDVLTINNGGVTEAVAGDGISVSAAGRFSNNNC